MKHMLEQVAGDAGDQVDDDHAEGAKQRLAKQAEVPEAPHVGGDVDQADVDKGGGQQATPDRRDEVPGGRWRRSGRAAGVGSYG